MSSSVDKFAAINVFENSTCKDTKSGYGSKMNYIFTYIEKCYPEYVEKTDGRLQFKSGVDENTGNNVEKRPDLPFDLFRELFGKISSDPSLAKQTKKAEGLEIQQRLDDLQCDDVDDFKKLKYATCSKSCMQGYKSALKNYYNTRDWKFEASNPCPNGLSLDKSADKSGAET